MGFPETFKALSDPVRREILMLLRGGRMPAGEIGQHFDVSGATISYHLSTLKKAGLVFETRHKNFIYYELNVTVFEEGMLWLAQFDGQKHTRRRREYNEHTETPHVPAAVPVPGGRECPCRGKA